jgi:hypothetical protein
VLEKVLGGGKPKRNIKQTLQAYRGALVAIGIIGIGLTVALVSPMERRSGQETGVAQTNDSGIVTKRSIPSLPSPEPAAQPAPTEPAAQVPVATTGETPSAQPVPITTKPEIVKVVASTRPEDPKGRSLPVGIEVKFMAGDVVSRLTSLRLEDQSEDKWLLTAGIFIRYSGKSWVDVFYGERYRLLIDGARVPPAKMSEYVRLQSDTETSGIVTFVIPKSTHRVGLHISYSENDYTTIPIDLKSGVSRTDVQPPGIPKSLPKMAHMDNVFYSSYDFRAVALEPYNVESFLLRIMVRVTTDSGDTFYSSSWRLVLENLPYAPVKATDKTLSAHTYADAEVAFIVPKSATQALLRVKDRDTWRNVPISLK